MRMRLSDLTLAEFIDLACGDNSVLLDDGESTDAAVLAHVRNNILSEYGFIADRTNAKSKMMDKEGTIKRESVLLVLKICNALLLLERFSDVRELLIEIEEYSGEKDEQLKKKVDRLIRLNEFEKKRAADMEEVQRKQFNDSPSPEKMRSAFYSEIAFLMTYFKMNIDSKQTNAEVYANLVRQADQEIRARKAKK